MKPERVQSRLPDWTVDLESGALSRHYRFARRLIALHFFNQVAFANPSNHVRLCLEGRDVTVRFALDDEGGDISTEIVRRAHVADDLYGDSDAL